MRSRRQISRHTKTLTRARKRLNRKDVSQWRAHCYWKHDYEMVWAITTLISISQMKNACKRTGVAQGHSRHQRGLAHQPHLDAPDPDDIAFFHADRVAHLDLVDEGAIGAIEVLEHPGIAL